MADEEIRIQFRRGTAAEWAAANPILGVGEPGYDTTSDILKVGDGTTAWSSLSGISEGAITQQELDNAISSIVDTAPETLNTLNELAAAINDNPNFFNEVAYSGGDISQFNNDVGYLTSENNDLTANVTWASVPDANITESSVIQHSGALRLTESQIVDLQSYVTSDEFNNGLVADSSFGDAAGTYCFAGTYNDSDYYTSTNGWVIYYNTDAYSWTLTNAGLGNFGTNDFDQGIADTGAVPLTGWFGQGLTDLVLTKGPCYVSRNDNVSVLVNDANYVASGDNISLLNNDVNYIESDTAGITGASGVNNIVQISQSDYDAIGSGNYDPNTIYFVP